MAIQLEPIDTSTEWGIEAGKFNSNNQKIVNAIIALQNSDANFKSWHKDINALNEAYPQAANKKGWFAWVGANPTVIWNVTADGGAWTNTTKTVDMGNVDLNTFATKQNGSGKLVVYSYDGKLDRNINFKDQDINESIPVFAEDWSNVSLMNAVKVRNEEGIITIKRDLLDGDKKYFLAAGISLKKNINYRLESTVGVPAYLCYAVPLSGLCVGYDGSLYGINDNGRLQDMYQKVDLLNGNLDFTKPFFARLNESSYEVSSLDDNGNEVVKFRISDDDINLDKVSLGFAYDTPDEVSLTLNDVRYEDIPSWTLNPQSIEESDSSDHLIGVNSETNIPVKIPTNTFAPKVNEEGNEVVYAKDGTINTSNLAQKEVDGKEVVYGSVATQATEAQNDSLVNVGLMNEELAKKDNLIAEYVHSGNKEVYVESIDYETNTFYAPNHGLDNSAASALTRVGFVKSTSEKLHMYDIFPLKTINNKGFFVINATQDTFQLSGTRDGAPIELEEKDTVDLSKFNIQKINKAQIAFANISHLNIDSFRLEIIGITVFSDWFSVNPAPVPMDVGNITNRTNSLLDLEFSSRIYGSKIKASGIGSIVYTSRRGGNIEVVDVDVRQVYMGNQAGRSNLNIDSATTVSQYITSPMVQIVLGSSVLANGTIVRLYKL